MVEVRAKLSFPVCQKINASLHVDTTVMSSSLSTVEAIFAEFEMVLKTCAWGFSKGYGRPWLELCCNVVQFFNCLLIVLLLQDHKAPRCPSVRLHNQADLTKTFAGRRNVLTMHSSKMQRRNLQPSANVCQLCASTSKLSVHLWSSSSPYFISFVYWQALIYFWCSCLLKMWYLLDWNTQAGAQMNWWILQAMWRDSLMWPVSSMELIDDCHNDASRTSLLWCLLADLCLS